MNSSARLAPLPALLVAAVLATAGGLARAQSADALPAFKTDSAAQDPFKKAEAAPAPWSGNPTGTAAKPDTGNRRDTVTARLTKRHPAISVWLGADFSDLDAKNAFNASLKARTDRDSLETLQGYESVQLAFPGGLQAVLPLGPWFDAVAKTRSFWSKQTAILGDKNKRAAGEEWYTSQANLGGLGLRYYVPPSLLSVTGVLGVYFQGVWLWNLGGTEIYTPYGSAPARFEPLGSGYDLQFGLQHSLSGPWQMAISIGFVQQDLTSDRNWSHILRDAAPAGHVHWSSSAAQANLALWYHFGVPADSVKSGAAAAAAKPNPPAAPVPVPDSTANPAVAPPAAPVPKGPGGL